VTSTYRIIHQPGLTSIVTESGVPVGIVIGSGALSLAYTADHRLLGCFDTMDQAVAEIERAVVAEAQGAA